MATVRKHLAMSKVDAAIQHIEHLVAHGEPVVAFVHHRECGDALEKHFGDRCVRVVGGRDAKKTRKSVEDFQILKAAARCHRGNPSWWRRYHAALDLAYIVLRRGRLVAPGRWTRPMGARGASGRSAPSTCSTWSSTARWTKSLLHGSWLVRARPVHERPTPSWCEKIN